MEEINVLEQKNTLLSSLKDSSYIKLGNKVFLISESEEEVNIELQYKQYIEDYLNNIKNQYENKFISAITQDFEKQVARLEKAKANNKITLPPELGNVDICYKTQYKDFFIIKIINYSPNVFRGSYDDFKYYSNFLFDFDANIDQNKSYEVTIKNKISIPLILYLNKNLNKVYAKDIYTFHSMSDARLCIGNNTVEKLLALNKEDFEKSFNRVNLYSLGIASLGYVKDFSGNILMSLKKLFVKNNIIKVERESQWKINS